MFVDSSAPCKMLRTGSDFKKIAAHLVGFYARALTGRGSDFFSRSEVYGAADGK